MKILISTSAKKFIINNKYGKLKAQWKTDLLEEEDDDYLPTDYNPKKVLELVIITASKIGTGYGDHLMKEFLSSSIAKEAELIFLDPNPYQGLFAKSKISDDVQIKKLIEFYSKYGFRHNPHSNRMWLVQKGSINTNELPT